MAKSSPCWLFVLAFLLPPLAVFLRLNEFSSCRKDWPWLCCCITVVTILTLLLWIPGNSYSPSPEFASVSAVVSKLTFLLFSDAGVIAALLTIVLVDIADSL